LNAGTARSHSAGSISAFLRDDERRKTGRLHRDDDPRAVLHDQRRVHRDHPAATLSGSATVNAGSLALCIPPGTGVRIQSGSVLGSNNYGEKGLIQDGSTWTSPGYGLSSTQIDLSISANAGSVELDPAGGCR
jgi:hypothetical protein